jgi:hypothetical protein
MKCHLSVGKDNIGVYTERWLPDFENLPGKGEGNSSRPLTMGVDLIWRRLSFLTFAILRLLDVAKTWSLVYAVISR